MKAGDVSRLLKSQDTFLLLIHHSPDGDAIASSLALSLALRSLNKSVDVVCADIIPVQFHFLPSVQKIKHDFFLGDYDIVITLDCGDSRRTGFRTRLTDIAQHKKVLLNIDHHPKNDLHSLATYNFVDETAPSTSFLVHDVIRYLGVPVDYKIATCLLTGLYTDTGGFKHPNTTPEALKFASALLAQGARLKDITSHISQFTSVSQLKLWGVALSRVQRHREFNIISTYISLQDIYQAGATEAEVAGIAALLASIPAEISVLMVERADDTIQVRLRTKSKTINVAQLANYLGGGGQRKAAGFSCRKAAQPVVPASASFLPDEVTLQV